ncbi:acetyl esterase/lipase [Rhodobacter sp. JA431]|uniref:alpha/beta hydrolase n=1 Tax=Rhodobacter sp. JA431 TaxID=570013 RepID=UPI000BC7F56D|nr:alpha/beta hydrolase [Rhodobacter sp. JA431]SOB92567.1 acetyl esterase/lipase [Rhodobacter sp. JA431]
MSLQLTLLNAALRLTTKPYLRKVSEPEKLRNDMERWARYGARSAPCTVAVPMTLAGRPALSIRSGKTIPDKVILHFHGGAFIAGSPNTHKAMLSRLARLAQVEVIAPAYRLAPEHPYPAALNDAEAAFEDLVTKGYAAENIVLSGDSAGAGLALSLLARLCKAGHPPAGIIALSPWTDLTGASPSLVLLEDRDPMLAAERMEEVAQYYLNGHRADDPAVSPLYASYPNCPPVLLQTSERDILRDDAMFLEHKLRDAGVDVTLQLWPDAPHVWQMFDGWVPEARAALRDAADFARKCLSLPARN